MTALQPFDFHGDRLEVIKQDGELYVSPRRVCDALGVAYSSQLQKLKQKPWATVLEINTVAEDGKPRPMSMLNVDGLMMWLANISINKVNPSARPKLIRYQVECAQVLADHFLGRRVAPDAAERWSQAQTRLDVIERLQRAKACCAEDAAIAISDVARSLGLRPARRVPAFTRRGVRGAAAWVDEPETLEVVRAIHERFGGEWFTAAQALRDLAIRAAATRAGWRLTNQVMGARIRSLYSAQPSGWIIERQEKTRYGRCWRIEKISQEHKTARLYG